MKWAQALDYFCSHVWDKYTFLAGSYTMLMSVLTCSVKMQIKSGTLDAVGNFVFFILLILGVVMKRFRNTTQESFN